MDIEEDAASEVAAPAASEAAAPAAGQESVGVGPAAPDGPPVIVSTCRLDCCGSTACPAVAASRPRSPAVA